MSKAMINRAMMGLWLRKIHKNKMQVKNKNTSKISIKSAK